jgi:hypothetical protein
MVLYQMFVFGADLKFNMAARVHNVFSLADILKISVPGTFTRLRSCIVPAEITEPPKISGGENHKYDGR